MDSARIDFAKKSLKKSMRFNDDPLIKFVVLWIGLNALYDDSNNESHEHETDKINNFFQQNEGKIRGVIHKRERELQEMRKVIQEYPQHDRISQFLQSRRAIFSYKHPDSVKHLSELLNKIRNNMFHAVKDWYEEAEQKLVSTINPILEDILSELTSS